MKFFKAGAGREQLRVSTCTTVGRHTGRLRSLIHAFPKCAAGVYEAGKRNEFLPFWKYRILAMVPKPSTEAQLPGTKTTEEFLCRPVQSLATVSTLRLFVPEWDRAVSHLNVVRSAFDLLRTVAWFVVLKRKFAVSLLQTLCTD